MCLSLSATVILSCLFLPKLRVVLLKPDKNVRSKSKITMKSTISSNPTYKDKNSTIKVVSPISSERAINPTQSINIKMNPSTFKKDIHSTSPLISEEKSIGQLSTKSQRSFVNSLTSSSNTALILKDSLLTKSIDEKPSKESNKASNGLPKNILKESIGFENLKKNSLVLAELTEKNQQITEPEKKKSELKSDQTDLESSLFSSLNQGSLTENSEAENNNSEKKILLFRRSKQQLETSETSRESSPENYEYLITLRKVQSSSSKSNASFCQVRDSTKLRKSTVGSYRSPSPKSISEIDLDDDFFNETMIRGVVEQCFEELSKNKKITGKRLCVKGKEIIY